MAIKNYQLQSDMDKIILQLKRTGCYIVLLLLTILSLFPFLIMIVNSSRFHSQIMQGFSLLPGRAFLQNWKELFTDGNIPIFRALLNSVFVSSMTAISTVYLTAMTAYGIHMYRFKGRTIAFNFIMLVMMVPTQVSTLGLIRLVMKMHLMDTYIPIIIPAAANPIVFFFMLQYMRSVLPFEMVEAARIDGASEVRTFNTIVLPVLKPAIAVQSIFTFVFQWNNYFLPALIINSKVKKTIPLLIAELRNTDYMRFDLGKVYMLIFLAIIPLMIMYFLLSKYIIRGITLGSVKG